ncbi:MAG: DUF6443 domain-containing protein [Bacteroidota bacterium]
MKRSLLTHFVCLLLLFGIHAAAFATITVTAPVLNQTVQIGTNLTINFNYSTYSPNFRGEFWKDGTTLVGSSFQVYTNISVGTSSLTPGTYKLKVYNGYNTSDYGWSDNFIVVYYPAPTGFYTNTITTTSFLLAWGSVSGATSYRLDVSTSSSFSSFVVNNASVTSTSYNPVTGLSSGTTYYCRVRAVGPNGTSDNSSTYAVTTYPDTPTATAASGLTVSSFVANWNTVTVANYLLYVATDNGFTSMVSGYNGLSVTGSSYTVSGLASNTGYYYRLKAVNSSGIQSSVSNTISTGTLPVAPTGFYTNVIANTSFLLAWSAVSGVSSYRVDVSTSSSFSTFVLSDALYNSPNYNAVLSLTPGTVYYCRVRSVGTYGNSANSSTYAVTTILDIPTATAATNVTHKAFDANWTLSTNATTYLLDVSTSGSFADYIPGYHDFPVSGATVNVSGLNQKTTYYYRVRASNAAYTTTYSNTISAVTLVSPYNYVKAEVGYVDNLTATTFPTASLTQKSTDIQYFDGLGRLIQTVNVKGSPGTKDIVTVAEYDVFGRQTKNYLPYPVASDGDFQSSATSAQSTFYSTTNGTYNNKVKTDDAPYSVKILEPSPLNRVLQEGAPGTGWQPNETTPASANSVQTNYYVNVDGTSSGQETIYIWSVLAGAAVEQAYATTTTTSKYPSNTLRIVEIKDEDKRTVRSYYDNRGLLILRKVQAVATPQTYNEADWAYTYYVYDVFDRLRFVLQPEFYTKLATYTGYVSANNTTAMTTMLDDWSFQYVYDMRGRMICKNIPGAKRVDMVYDDWDRIVLTQDAVQAGSTKWSFNKYDVFNRAIVTGEYTSSNNRSAMATAVAASTGRFEVVQSGSIGYTVNGSYPTTVTISDINVITFYDDYSFKTSLTLGTGYDYNPTGSTNTRVKNLGTGAKERILGSSNWLISANYFDDRYRLTQKIGDDHLANKNRISNVYYGITSWITSTSTTHGSLLTKLDEADYDHRGRITKTYTTMDGGTRVITSGSTYNEIGQLVDKGVHSTNGGTSFLQSVDYRYNIRGWNTHINNSSISNDGTTNDDANDLFGMELKYDQVISINGGNTKGQFGGNIASMQWSTNNMHDPVVERIYGFAYDDMNRLKDATYSKKSSGVFSADANLYDENLTYDKNGNIATLNRKGLLGTANTPIDQLQYTYSGNQLSYVTDNSPYYSYSSSNPAYGFIEDTQAPSAEYGYNDNGAVTSDLNKKVTSITYNILNLPVLITMSGSRTIEYTWSATGAKLKKVVKIGSNIVAQSDYIDGIQYENTTLSFVGTSDGRVIKTTSGWDYEYFLKDHLGNTRVAYGVMKIANTYTATMEDATANQEAQDFKNVSETRYASVNHTATSGLYPTPNNSSRTNSVTPVGPAKMLAVQQHDAVTLTAYTRFNTSIGGNNTLIANVANAVLSGYGLTNVGESAAAYTALQSAIPGYSATVSNSSSTVPKAYLAYVLFNSSYGSPQFGFQQISTSANGAWQTLTISIADMPNDGYLYAYVINESSVTDVYFDDVSIAHTRTNAGLLITQTNDYYAFGMAISPLSYQNQATNRNDYKYNGKELQDEFGLNWVDYGARMYMPDIARWGVVDPLADNARRWTPYRYGFDNPMRFVDPDGMFEYSNGYQTLNSDNETGAVSHEGVFSMPESNASGASTATPQGGAPSQVPTGGGSGASAQQGLRPVNITVSGTPSKTTAVTWSYPNDDGNLYTIPTYTMTVSGTDAQGNTVTRTFEVLRFGVNREASMKTPKIVGLADKQSYTIKVWNPNYKVHSYKSPEDGSWKVKGGFLIHDGPDKPMTQYYATKGCIEVCGGPAGFVQFNTLVKDLSGATSLNQVASSGVMTITYQQASRPPLTLYKP